MQDIRWNAFWLAVALAIFCLIIGLVKGEAAALWTYSIVVTVYLVSHLRWLYQLQRWLKKPASLTVPHGAGIWEHVFSDLHQLQRSHSSSQTQFISALDRYRDAASALPDGVVALNDKDRIDWCNAAAERLLGLSLAQDVGQPIYYLVRQPEFIQCLQMHDYTNTFRLRSWQHQDLILEIQFVSFGAGQKLLICRDVSQQEKLDTMRRDFIANVSHELRTPLTVIGGFLETLSDMDGAVPEGQRQYFTLMLKQAERMRHLVEDLLTLSQLENGRTAPQDTEVDVGLLLNQVMNESRELSKGAHKISLVAEPGLGLTGASTELHSAFGNLVSNAVRYTPEGGHVAISWKTRGEEAVFSVKDSGIGIEQQHISRLTERFYRVDSSRSRETGGTGLGLSIVKHILIRHQARLEIESKPGEGSTFSAVFPFNRIVHKTPASSLKS
ncbi:MAG: phosphate regulon sensor histidine kinase PhoR [Methylophilaceae bacterium]|nr:phosphate regulon sensor histidine kinase PhoR [Methylophilaceae bacterium]